MTNSTGKVFKLTAAGSIRKALGDVVEAKRNITISALFHGLISSNVSWATDMQRSDAADFDMVLRTLLPIKFNKESGKYEFNAKAAPRQHYEKQAKRLGMTLRGYCLRFNVRGVV